MLFAPTSGMSEPAVVLSTIAASMADDASTRTRNSPGDCRRTNPPKTPVTFGIVADVSAGDAPSPSPTVCDTKSSAENHEQRVGAAPVTLSTAAAMRTHPVNDVACSRVAFSTIVAYVSVSSSTSRPSCEAVSGESFDTFTLAVSRAGNTVGAPQYRPTPH